MFLHAVGLEKSDPVIEHGQAAYVGSINMRGGLYQRLLAEQGSLEVDWNVGGVFKKEGHARPFAVHTAIWKAAALGDIEYDDGRVFVNKGASKP